MTHKEFGDRLKGILEKKEPGKITVDCRCCGHDREINLWEKEAIDLLTKFINDPSLSTESLNDLGKRILRLNFACDLIFILLNTDQSPIYAELVAQTGKTLGYILENLTETSGSIAEFMTLARGLDPRLLSLDNGAVIPVHLLFGLDGTDEEE